MTMESISTQDLFFEQFVMPSPGTAAGMSPAIAQPHAPLERPATALRVSKSAVAPSAKARRAWPAGGWADRHDLQIKDARIAIIDDEPSSIRVAQKHLQEFGFHSFLTVSDSQQAWQVIQRDKPDLVLMDISMPDVSGLDILRRMRRAESTRRLPVLFLTVVSDPKVRRTAIELGAADFLRKPVDPHELVARVRNALVTKACQDELAQETELLETEVRRRTAELIASRQEVIECLARTAEFRDNESGQHVIRVGKYVAIMARKLGFSQQAVELLEMAARLHDLGKIALPDSIICHPGPLEPEQFALVRKHCAVGQEVLEPIADEHWQALRSHARIGATLLHVRSSPLLMLAAKVAQTHHERWDGTGYPLGLCGEQIPIEGRMTAVADVYDVLSSRRPYKPPFPREKCCAIMEEGRGTQFDPHVLDAFFASKDEVIEVQIQYVDLD